MHDINRPKYNNTFAGGTQGPEVIEQFLKQLRPNGPWILLAALPDEVPPKSGIPQIIAKTFNTSADALAFVVQHNGTRNLYYSTNPTKKPMSKKPAKIDIAAIEYFLADCDPAEGEKPEDAKARYLGQLNNDFDPPPTAVVNSGGGIQCLWRLNQPIDLSQYPLLTIEGKTDEKGKKGKDKLVLGPEALKIVEDAEARTEAIMLRLGAKAGTQNIDRILRLPGTINLPNEKKRKDGRVECPTGVISFNDASYALESFPLPEPAKESEPRADDPRPKGEGDRLERLIRDGPLPAEFPSRSHAVFYVVCEMLRRGYLEQTIESTLLDHANKISAHIYDQPNPRAYVKKQIADAKKEVNLQNQPAPPEVLDAGDDLTKPPPRAWLYGNIFARRFLSSLFGDGGIGKTALRYAQYMSLATGKNLVGDHVFQRCRVLIVSLEDDIDELRRRIWALRIQYGITPEELKGWLFLWAPGARGGKIMHLDKRGNPVVGKLRAHLEAMINDRNIDLVGIDPFVKSHGVGENNNTAIDMVVQVLVDLSHKLNVGIDVPHHVSKAPRNGGGVEPGDADRGRGASAMKDAARLVYTLNVMTKDEAEKFGIGEEDRWAYVRMDKAKVNIIPPARQAKWFHLVGVPIGNADDIYINGDEVQAVERWNPPDVMGGLSNADISEILARIDKGMGDGRRYSDAPTAKARAAWKVVVDVCPEFKEARARDIIKTWVKNGVLVSQSYRNDKDRKDEDGLWRGGTIEIQF